MTLAGSTIKFAQILGARMAPSIFCVVLTCFLGTSLSAQDSDGSPETATPSTELSLELDERAERFVPHFKEIAESQLVLIENKYGLSKQEIDNVRQRLLPAINKAAFQTSRGSYSEMGFVPPELKLDIARVLKPHLSQEEFDELISRLSLKLEVENAAAQALLITHIDFQVFLTAEQRSSLQTAFADQWNSHWNSASIQAGFGNQQFFGIDRAVKRAGLLDCLTPMQLEVLLTSVNKLLQFENVEQADKEEAIELLRTHYQQIAELKLQEIDAACELDDIENRRLAIASKGAVQQFSQQMIGELDSKQNLFNLRKLSAMLQQPGFEIFNKKPWIKGVRSSLPEKKVDEIAKLNSARIKFQKDAMLVQYVAQIVGDNRLNRETYTATLAMLRRELIDDVDIPFGVASDPLEGINSITREQWDEVLPKNVSRKVRRNLQIGQLIGG
jgi:hypothetical protein